MTVGAYIHIPFCENKCDYCDFYSIVASEEERKDYIQALLGDIIRNADKSAIIDTIYFGGGNPGLLLPHDVNQLIQAMDEHYLLDVNPEITLECNPTSVSEATLKAFHRAGINRLSLGVQSFNGNLLATLGRQRSKYPDDIIAIAVSIFPRVSLDLMLGIPGQTIQNVKEDLSRIPKDIGHLSLYELTVYPKTRFSDHIKKGLICLNTDEESEGVERFFVESLQGQGFSQYEVSNFSKQDQQSKHNLHYWHYDDFKGFGAGAVSSWKGARYFNTKLPQYMQGVICDEREDLPESTQKLEWLMMNLRLTDGFERKRYRARFGLDVLEDFSSIFEEQAEWFRLSPDSIALTSKGLLFHHNVLSAFVAKC